MASLLWNCSLVEITNVTGIKFYAEENARIIAEWEKEHDEVIKLVRRAEQQAIAANAEKEAANKKEADKKTDKPSPTNDDDDTSGYTNNKSGYTNE